MDLTLINLGDREAVPLAIARINPEHRKSYNMRRLGNELNWGAGKSYGFNREKWQRWWRAVEETWQVSEAVQKPWEEQKRYHPKSTPNEFEAFLITFY